MTQQRALGWLAVGAVLAIAWLAYPVSVGILLGALLAFTVEPVYDVLVSRTGRPLAASLMTVMATATGIVGLLADSSQYHHASYCVYQYRPRRAGPGRRVDRAVRCCQWVARPLRYFRRQHHGASGGSR